MKFIHGLTLFTVFLLLSSFTIFPISPAYAAAPGAPTNGRPSGPPTTTTLTISWTAPASGSTPTNGYKIESAAETSFGQFPTWITKIANTTNTDTTNTITGLTAGQFFKFRISAHNLGETGVEQSLHKK